MKRFLIPAFGALAVVAVVFLVLGGGSGEGSGAEGAPRDPMTGKTEFDIPVQDPTLVAEGEDLYRAACAACHGSDLRGTAVGPPHLSVIYNPEHHGDGAFALAVVNGVKSHHYGFGDMPAIPTVTEENFARILAYIRETQRTEGFVAYP
jgi:mono/diheme cytochrome c family protein